MWPLSTRRENAFFPSAKPEAATRAPVLPAPSRTEWKPLSRYAGLVFFSAFLALFMIESTDPHRGFLPVVLDPPPAHSEPRGFQASLGVSRWYSRAVLSDPQPLVSNSGEYYAFPPTEGIASWYGHDHIGRKTADGGWFDPEAMTAAHRTLPFGSIVRVTRLDTGASVEVSINDRGPYIKGRIIDLSRRPASELGLFDHGIVKCRIEVLRYPHSGVASVPKPARPAAAPAPLKKADPALKTMIDPSAEVLAPVLELASAQTESEAPVD